MNSIPTHNRTLITKNYLYSIIECIEGNKYDLKDFEISTERVQGYKNGRLNPKAIIYVFRISTGIEKSYVLKGKISFSDALCNDLKMRVFDCSY